ncbi:hypothetical protein SDC9_79252 [bioreactor metagenome]|uniref:Uncharacterized protein n=1 Tax=bioreactor metagenome TaxID=1076179 RepID=A0A644YWF2_9ZZZZ
MAALEESFFAPALPLSRVKTTVEEGLSLLAEKPTVTDAESISPLGSSALADAFAEKSISRCPISMTEPMDETSRTKVALPPDASILIAPSAMLAFSRLQSLSLMVMFSELYPLKGAALAAIAGDTWVFIKKKMVAKKALKIFSLSFIIGTYDKKRFLLY